MHISAIFYLGVFLAETTTEVTAAYFTLHPFVGYGCWNRWLTQEAFRNNKRHSPYGVHTIHRNLQPLTSQNTTEPARLEDQLITEEIELLRDKKGYPRKPATTPTRPRLLKLSRDRQSEGSCRSRNPLSSQNTVSSFCDGYATENSVKLCDSFLTVDESVDLLRDPTNTAICNQDGSLNGENDKDPQCPLVQRHTDPANSNKDINKSETKTTEESNRFENAQFDTECYSTGSNQKAYCQKEYGRLEETEYNTYQESQEHRISETELTQDIANFDETANVALNKSKDGVDYPSIPRLENSSRNRDDSEISLADKATSAPALLVHSRHSSVYLHPDADKISELLTSEDLFNAPALFSDLNRLHKDFFEYAPINFKISSEVLDKAEKENEAKDGDNSLIYISSKVINKTRNSSLSQEQSPHRTKRTVDSDCNAASNKECGYSICAAQDRANSGEIDSSDKLTLGKHRVHKSGIFLRVHGTDNASKNVLNSIPKPEQEGELKQNISQSLVTSLEISSVEGNHYPFSTISGESLGIDSIPQPVSLSLVDKFTDFLQRNKRKSDVPKQKTLVSDGMQTSSHIIQTSEMAVRDGVAEETDPNLLQEGGEKMTLPKKGFMRGIKILRWKKDSDKSKVLKEESLKALEALSQQQKDLDEISKHNYILEDLSRQIRQATQLKLDNREDLGNVSKNELTNKTNGNELCNILGRSPNIKSETTHDIETGMNEAYTDAPEEQVSDYDGLNYSDTQERYQDVSNKSLEQLSSLNFAEKELRNAENSCHSIENRDNRESDASCASKNRGHSFKYEDKPAYSCSNADDACSETDTSKRTLNDSFEELGENNYSTEVQEQGYELKNEQSFVTILRDTESSSSIKTKSGNSNENLSIKEEQNHLTNNESKTSLEIQNKQPLTIKTEKKDAKKKIESPSLKRRPKVEPVVCSNFSSKSKLNAAFSKEKSFCDRRQSWNDLGDSLKSEERVAGREEVPNKRAYKPEKSQGILIGDSFKRVPSITQKKFVNSTIDSQQKKTKGKSLLTLKEHVQSQQSSEDPNTLYYVFPSKYYYKDDTFKTEVRNAPLAFTKIQEPISMDFHDLSTINEEDTNDITCSTSTCYEQGKSKFGSSREDSLTTDTSPRLSKGKVPQSEESLHRSHRFFTDVEQMEQENKEGFDHTEFPATDFSEHETYTLDDKQSVGPENYPHNEMPGQYEKCSNCSIEHKDLNEWKDSNCSKTYSLKDPIQQRFYLSPRHSVYSSQQSTQSEHNTEQKMYVDETLGTLDDIHSAKFHSPRESATEQSENTQHRNYQIEGKENFESDYALECSPCYPQFSIGRKSRLQYVEQLTTPSKEPAVYTIQDHIYKENPLPTSKKPSFLAVDEENSVLPWKNVKTGSEWAILTELSEKNKQDTDEKEELSKIDTISSRIWAQISTALPSSSSSVDSTNVSSSSSSDSSQNSIPVKAIRFAIPPKRRHYRRSHRKYKLRKTRGLDDFEDDFFVERAKVIEITRKPDRNALKQNQKKYKANKEEMRTFNDENIYVMNAQKNRLKNIVTTQSTEKSMGDIRPLKLNYTLHGTEERSKKRKEGAASKPLTKSFDDVDSIAFYTEDESSTSKCSDSSTSKLLQFYGAPNIKGEKEKSKKNYAATTSETEDSSSDDREVFPKGNKINWRGDSGDRLAMLQMRSHDLKNSQRKGRISPNSFRFIKPTHRTSKGSRVSEGNSSKASRKMHEQKDVKKDKDGEDKEEKYSDQNYQEDRKSLNVGTLFSNEINMRTRFTGGKKNETFPSESRFDRNVKMATPNDGENYEYDNWYHKPVRTTMRSDYATKNYKTRGTDKKSSEKRSRKRQEREKKDNNDDNANKDGKDDNEDKEDKSPKNQPLCKGQLGEPKEISAWQELRYSTPFWFFLGFILLVGLCICFCWVKCKACQKKKEPTKMNDCSTPCEPSCMPTPSCVVNPAYTYECNGNTYGDTVPDERTTTEFSVTESEADQVSEFYTYRVEVEDNLWSSRFRPRPLESFQEPFANFVPGPSKEMHREVDLEDMMQRTLECPVNTQVTRAQDQDLRSYIPIKTFQVSRCVLNLRGDNDLSGLSSLTSGHDLEKLKRERREKLKKQAQLNELLFRNALPNGISIQLINENLAEFNKTLQKPNDLMKQNVRVNGIVETKCGNQTNHTANIQPLPGQTNQSVVSPVKPNPTRIQGIKNISNRARKIPVLQKLNVHKKPKNTIVNEQPPASGIIPDTNPHVQQMPETKYEISITEHKHPEVSNANNEIELEVIPGWESRFFFSKEKRQVNSKIENKKDNKPTDAAQLQNRKITDASINQELQDTWLTQNPVLNLEENSTTTCKPVECWTKEMPSSKTETEDPGLDKKRSFRKWIVGNKNYRVFHADNKTATPSPRKSPFKSWFSGKLDNSQTPTEGGVKNRHEDSKLLINNKYPRDKKVIKIYTNDTELPPAEDVDELQLSSCNHWIEEEKEKFRGSLDYQPKNQTEEKTHMDNNGLENADTCMKNYLRHWGKPADKENDNIEKSFFKFWLNEKENIKKPFKKSSIEKENFATIEKIEKEIENFNSNKRNELATFQNWLNGKKPSQELKNGFRKKENPVSMKREIEKKELEKKGFNENNDYLIKENDKKGNADFCAQQNTTQKKSTQKLNKTESAKRKNPFQGAKKTNEHSINRAGELKNNAQKEIEARFYAMRNTKPSASHEKRIPRYFGMINRKANKIGEKEENNQKKEEEVKMVKPCTIEPPVQPQEELKKNDRVHWNSATKRTQPGQEYREKHTAKTNRRNAMARRFPEANTVTVKKVTVPADEKGEECGYAESQIAQVGSTRSYDSFFKDEIRHTEMKDRKMTEVRRRVRFTSHAEDDVPQTPKPSRLPVPTRPYGRPRTSRRTPA